MPGDFIIPRVLSRAEHGECCLLGAANDEPTLFSDATWFSISTHAHQNIFCKLIGLWAWKIYSRVCLLIPVVVNWNCSRNGNLTFQFRMRRGQRAAQGDGDVERIGGKKKQSGLLFSFFFFILLLETSGTWRWTLHRRRKTSINLHQTSPAAAIAFSNS